MEIQKDTHKIMQYKWAEQYSGLLQEFNYLLCPFMSIRTWWAKRFAHCINHETLPQCYFCHCDIFPNVQLKENRNQLNKSFSTQTRNVDIRQNCLLLTIKKCNFAQGLPWCYNIKLQQLYISSKVLELPLLMSQWCVQGESWGEGVFSVLSSLW